MGFIKEMLSDGGGVSTMRVMSLLSLMIGGGVATVGLLKGLDLSSVAVLAGVFVGAAFGGKAAQSFAGK